jgi:hypothetical protein
MCGSSVSRHAIGIVTRKKPYVSGRRLSRDLPALPGKILGRHINDRACNSIAVSEIQIGIS